MMASLSSYNGWLASGGPCTQRQSAVAAEKKSFAGVYSVTLPSNIAEQTIQILSLMSRHEFPSEEAARSLLYTTQDSFALDHLMDRGVSIFQTTKEPFRCRSLTPLLI